MKVHAGGLQIEQHRHLAADPIQFVEVVGDAGAAGDGGEMHDARWSSREVACSTTEALRNAALVSSSLGFGPPVFAICDGVLAGRLGEARSGRTIRRARSPSPAA